MNPLRQTPSWTSRGPLLAVLGVVLIQALLFGRSFCGQTILFAADILDTRPFLAGPPAGGTEREPYDRLTADLILQTAPCYEFEARELRSGRWPLWNPMVFAGAPNVLFSPFCPFYWIFFLFPGRWAFVWVQLAKALAAGTGAYGFLRRVAGTGVRPAVVGAWCYPITGYFVYWQGFHPTDCTAWLPWLLWATVAVTRNGGALRGSALAAFTALSLVGSKLDVGLQMLMVSGITAIWAVAVRTGDEPVLSRVRRLAFAWAMGILLAAPYWMPLLAYMSTGERLAQRIEGRLDHPPVGQVAIPEVLLPEILGSTRFDSARLTEVNVAESSSTASAGLLTILVLAPLAWSGRTGRPQRWLFTTLVVVGLAWAWNVPVLGWLLGHLPGVRLLSHNRLTFATGLGLLSLGMMGLDALESPGAQMRRWFVVLPVLAASLAAVCLWCAVHPPPGLPAGCGGLLGAGPLCPAERNLVAGALLAVLCLLSWLGLHARRSSEDRAGWLRCLLPLALVAELTYHATGVRAQCDPALYYPPRPLVEALSRCPPGRILGMRCLNPNVGMMYGLSEIRGYDGIDPHRLIRLLRQVEGSGSAGLPHALLISYRPKVRLDPDGSVSLPAALDMLGVRYLMGIGEVPAGARPRVAHQDQWVLENRHALPRTWVPGRVTCVPDEESLVRRVADDFFDPAAEALVETPVPGLPAQCRGRAAVVQELPCEVVVDAELLTPGLVILGDRHDAGWHAHVSGHEVPVLPVNYILRGVVLPAGRHRITFTYAPASVFHATVAALFGLSGLAAWGLAARRVTAARS